MVEIEASEDKTEDLFTFSVRDIDEVRLNGESAEDFYITNTGSNFRNTICYINYEKQLYRYRYQRKAGKTYTQLIAENVVHVDYGNGYFIFLAEDGKLYGMENSENRALLVEENEYMETPAVLMEDVKYALCGSTDVVALKRDGSVWTWGDNTYDTG